MKTCSTCKIDKDETEYSFRNKAKGLLQHQCNDCRRLSAKLSYQKHKKAVVAKVLVRNLEKRDWFQDIKAGLSCCVCGENDPICLDFHHLDPNEKDFEPAKGRHTKSKADIIKELNKCACLCSNCHRKQHAGRLNAPLVKLEII